MMDRGRPDNPLEYAPDGKPYQGSAIRQIRQAKNLGLRQLAALIPYHYGALSNVENNRATVSSETLQRIAELLGVAAEELERRPVHPRLAQQQAGAREHHPTGDQTRALEALTAEVQALKAEVAKVAPVARYGHLLPAPSGAGTPPRVGAFGAGGDLGSILTHSKTDQQQTNAASQQYGQSIGVLVEQIMAETQLTSEEKRLVWQMILETTRAMCEVFAKEREMERR